MRKKIEKTKIWLTILQVSTIIALIIVIIAFEKNNQLAVIINLALASISALIAVVLEIKLYWLKQR